MKFEIRNLLKAECGGRNKITNYELRLYKEEGRINLQHYFVLPVEPRRGDMIVKCKFGLKPFVS